MQSSRLTAWKFTPFKIDLDRGVLTLSDQERILRPKAFDVLLVLVERSGQVVPTRDIVDAVWGATPPSDPKDSTGKCIKEIRQALGAEHEWMVQTVSGTGYKFSPAVTAVHSLLEPDLPLPWPETPDQKLPRIHSMAQEALSSPIIEVSATDDMKSSLVVQPWQIVRLAAATAATVGVVMLLALSNRSTPPATDAAFGPHMMATPSVAFLPTMASTADAQTPLQTFIEEIASELRRTPKGYDLAIKAAMPQSYRDQTAEAAAKGLDVRYLLRTAAREEAGSRQVIVHLVEGLTGRQIWSSQYIQPGNGIKTQNILAAQIAREVAVQIRTSENVRSLPPQPRAGHFTLQGRVILEGERDVIGNQKAMTLFDKAVAMDPKHVQAHLGYSRTRVAAIANGWVSAADRPKYLADAEAGVTRILALDKSTVGAHLLRGSIERIKGNYDGAIASLEYATSLNPNYVLAHAELGRTKLDMGRQHETIAHIERALELSPRDHVASFWYYWAGMAAAQLGDYKTSLEFMHKALQANGNYSPPRPWMAIAYVKLNQPDEAAKAIQYLLAKAPKFNVETWMGLLARGDRRIIERIEPFAAILRQLGVPAKT
jgi:DNA-binding winged helix-turn-helix (wHTH) protein/tetratricopeptide (TPR) repeat protein